MQRRGGESGSPDIPAPVCARPPPRPQTPPPPRCSDCNQKWGIWPEQRQTSLLCVRVAAPPPLPGWPSCVSQLRCSFSYSWSVESLSSNSWCLQWCRNAKTCERLKKRKKWKRMISLKAWLTAAQGLAACYWMLHLTCHTLTHFLFLQSHSQHLISPTSDPWHSDPITSHGREHFDPITDLHIFSFFETNTDSKL